MNPQKAGSEPGPAAAARPRPAGASPVPPRGSAGTTGTAQGFRRYRRPLRGSAGPAPPAAIGAPGKSAEAGACGGCGSAPAPLPPLRCCRCENYALGADMRQRFAIRQDFLPGTSIFVGCGFYFGWGSVWFFFFPAVLYVRGRRRWRSRPRWGRPPWRHRTAPPRVLLCCCCWLVGFCFLGNFFPPLE